ncbi:radical SAM protein [Erythrobacter rubeus]|uniref:Coproporphyrinogen-III oxidase n=1 Tax=Erythrobacter rubeus TaxID=2760803 RepID=A0ABR8KL33_9SPHN|nr:radical SAM protein [Erythrobacter rubeus]MBD2841058.1 coproporphyrinogen dehydrogenase [Erythrobacter rubeus]
MWTYHSDLLEKAVPRYTSYPTAADFGPIDPVELGAAIERAEGDVSLYLHVPFCEKICYYCGCNTGASGRRQRVESYLDALHAELATVSTLLPDSARVRRIAFGGGSPNAIRPDEFLGLVEAINRQFGTVTPAWSIELDPRSMTREWGAAIGSAGITRASMGVQTFAAHCQKAIGREQSDALICRSIDWLRSAGVTSLNFDLMYGLPGQTERDLEDSLEYTRLLAADRIALFGYAHVPQLVPRQRMIDEAVLPGNRERFQMARLGHEFLTSHGYDAVGFDHFALPHDPLAAAAGSGTLRRNFQGFTDDSADAVIGLGASAISAFPELLAQNEKNSGRYRMIASQRRLSASHGVTRSRRDRLNGAAIEKLLCQGSAEITLCQMPQVRERLTPFLDRELAVLDDMTLSITPGGLPYARSIAALFDTFRQERKRTFSSAI